MGRELTDYYKRIFGLAHHHKYSIHDLENLMAYELDIYIDLANEAQKEATQAASGTEVQNWYEPT